MADTSAPPHVVARRLMRGSRHAVLCTALVPDGSPYGSLVAVADDVDASPLLYLSDLAEHTKNLKADPRAALVFRPEEGAPDPLARPRATATGRIAPAAGEAALARYLARHPEAERYRGFRDFGLYRMQVERVHLVAGFGVIQWLDAAAVLG